MTKKLPLSDFRAVRHKLEPHQFALSEGQDIAPTHLVDEETWSGITHLPDDVAKLTFFTTIFIYAICYLLVRIARPDFILPPDSRILFEKGWVPNRDGIARAFEQLYQERAAVLEP